MSEPEYVPPTDLVDPAIAVSDCTALPLFIPYFGASSGSGGCLGAADVEAARREYRRAQEAGDTAAVPLTPVIALDNVERAIKEFFAAKTLDACECAFYHVLRAAALLASRPETEPTTVWLACAGTREVRGVPAPSAALLYYDAVGLALAAGYMKAAVPMEARRSDDSEGKTWFHTAYNLIYHVFLPNGASQLSARVLHSITALQQEDVIPDTVGFELLLDAAYIGLSFERHCVQNFGFLDSATRESPFATIRTWFSADASDRSGIPAADIKAVWRQMNALFTLREACNVWIERAMAYIKVSAAANRPRAGFLLHALAWTARLGFTAEIIYAAYGVYANRVLVKDLANAPELVDTNGRYFCETYVLAIRKHMFYSFYKDAGSIPPVAVEVPEELLWPAEVTLSFGDWYTYHPLLDQAEMAYLVWVLRLRTEFSRELVACALQLEAAVAAMHDSFPGGPAIPKPTYEVKVAQYVSAHVLRSGEVRFIADNGSRGISSTLAAVSG